MGFWGLTVSLYKALKNNLKKFSFFLRIFSRNFEKKLSQQFEAKITTYVSTLQGEVCIKSYSILQACILMNLNRKEKWANLSSSYRDLD